jgi:hypothetical protein
MNRKAAILVMAVCATALALGVARLFELRFESGDVYPAYSSLRADPLGTSVLYESLGRMPDVSVSRDLNATDKLPPGRRTTYLHLAADSYDWRYLPSNTFREVDSFVRSGGRLVIAFFPETEKPFSTFWDEESTNLDRPLTKTGKPTGAGRTNAVPLKGRPGDRYNRSGLPGLMAATSLKEHWGIDFGFVELPQGTNDAYEPVTVRNVNDQTLQRSISWHSGLIFTNVDSEWKVIYARGTNPVVVERKFGAGTVVMGTDSYFLSNEAMLKERHADLLAWVIGPAQSVVFDEAHLGIVEEPGVAMLARKYHLGLFLAGLLMLAGLFIWKSMTRFAPDEADEERGDFVTGRDSAAGFVNLLRRHVPVGNVLDACLAEWRKSAGRTQFSATRMNRVQEEVAAGRAAGRHPVDTYGVICRVLKPGNATGKTAGEEKT